MDMGDTNGNHNEPGGEGSGVHLAAGAEPALAGKTEG